MLLLAKVQLHDHPSVFGVAEFFAAIAAELSVRLCHKSFSAPLVFCGGLEMAAKKALQTSGKFIPWQVVTISIDGKILD